MTERDYFVRHCQLNCVSDPAVIERLWQQRLAERARLEETERGSASG